MSKFPPTVKVFTKSAIAGVDVEIKFEKRPRIGSSGSNVSYTLAYSSGKWTWKSKIPKKSSTTYVSPFHEDSQEIFNIFAEVLADVKLPEMKSNVMMYAPTSTVVAPNK